MILEKLSLLEYRPATLIRATGEDAFTFLQGQFTNELRQPLGGAMYGLWLDQKGKVLADSYILRVSESEFQICSVSSSAEVIRKRLEDYIVADDVVLSDEIAATHGLVVLGAHSGAALEKIMGARPVGGRFVRGADVIAFAGRRTAGENFEVLGEAEPIRKMKEQLLAAGASVVEPLDLEYARIVAEIPAVPADIGPGDLPNEAGLDAVAISYTKGCYLGQEVMARLKNLGQVRRRLHVVRGKGTPPASRAALYQADKKVGEIRSVAAGGDGFAALAMLSLINFKAAEGLALEPGGPAIITADPHG